MGEEVQDRIAAVRQRVRDACLRSGRDPTGVSIVAVAKTFGPDEIRALADAGIEVFGENRVQEGRAKIPMCPGHLDWHLVGHLQRNKAREAVRLFSTIHSADSADLLEALDRACADAGLRRSVFLEVNVSGEGSKFGCRPADLPGLLERCNRLMNLEVAGLMTVPPFCPQAEGSRPHFRHLRELRDRCRALSGYGLDELSMGMSGDYEVAIEEGATRVRLGRALFGERQGRAWKPTGEVFTEE